MVVEVVVVVVLVVGVVDELHLFLPFLSLLFSLPFLSFIGLNIAYRHVRGDIPSSPSPSPPLSVLFVSFPSLC